LIGMRGRSWLPGYQLMTDPTGSDADRPRVTVIMPTFRHDAFIARAIDSLFAQTLTDWQLIIVDDGTPDDTFVTIANDLVDSRVRCEHLKRNHGLGRALNVGLDYATSKLIAYLPSDDLFYADHLESLANHLDEEPTAILAYSGVRHHYNRTSPGQIDGEFLQLVQVMHRKTPDRWVERSELTTDDLNRMHWTALHRRGQFVETDRVSCEWVDHPRQRHKLLREPVGGINTYRSYYGVAEPLRVHTSVGNHIDERTRYRLFRDRPATPPAAESLKILIVGELAYNADRILALEERGHQLYGLWMPDPYWYNTVGPLPFGHVQDLPRSDWKAAVNRIQPDLIYALLYWQAVHFAHHVLLENPGIPFVWHFKEGPFICMEKGTWTELVELYTRADGQIYSSPEMRDWFMTVLPDAGRGRLSHVLDGDLPKRDWFGAHRSPHLSDTTGQIHTVVPGRPIGLHPPDVAELAAHNIHLHFYGDFTHGQWIKWIKTTTVLAPNHLHLHAQVDQDRWVSEFSSYDAGWLHSFTSENGGDIRRANWDDLNYPARMATLAAAGLPMLQKDNSGAIVATQTLSRERDLGIFFSTTGDLAAQFTDDARMSSLRESVWQQRDLFTFDHHADRLVAFFRSVISASR